MADLPAIMTLPQYLASLRHRRWKPGQLDCGVFMADWVRLLTGIDPIADVRGRYSTERQFLRIVRAEGGFEASCATRLKAAGFRETTEVRAGDVMTVSAPYAQAEGGIKRQPTGAIAVSTEARAVVTSDRGVVIANKDTLPMINAWTLKVWTFDA